jgi:hypothetical protein
MSRLRLCLVPGLIWAATLWSAPVERDLGQGLVYARIHELPRDLPAKPAARVPACVVDVRYVRAPTAATTAFVAWLRFRATPHSPVFVLANAETEPELVRALAGHQPAAGVFVVGIPGGSFTPDIAVKGTAERERRAYDAFEQGAALAQVLTDNPEKVRNDEASLSKDRLAEAAAEAAEDVLTGKSAVTPVDASLQRAVHLHRALLALKKI